MTLVLEDTVVGFGVLCGVIYYCWNGRPKPLREAIESWGASYLLFFSQTKIYNQKPDVL